jgi:RNA polymerase sigma-70 factor (ECF subfamily)
MNRDSRIIEMLHRREEAALQMIRDEFSSQCGQIAYRITGNREDAEECVNDMLLDVWNTVPPNHPNDLQAYLVSLVRRRAIDRYRYAHRQKRSGMQTTALDELADILPSEENVETIFTHKQITDVVRTFLDTLSLKNRRVFLQRYLMAMPEKEIAADNEMSLISVKVMLHRTRKHIQEYLRKEGFI